MSFNAQGLNLSTYSANEIAPRIHTYTSSEDTLDAITSNVNYFGSVAPSLSANDLFYISDSTKLPNGKGLFYVVSVSIYSKTVELNALGNTASPVAAYITVASLAASTYRITGFDASNDTLTAAIPAANVVVNGIYPISFGESGLLPDTDPEIFSIIENTVLEPAPGLPTTAFYFIKIVAIAPAVTFSIYSTLADATAGNNVYVIINGGSNAEIVFPYQLNTDYGYFATNEVVVAEALAFTLPPAANLNIGDTIHFSNVNGGGCYIFQNAGQRVAIGSGGLFDTTGTGQTTLLDGVATANYLYSETAGQTFDLVVLSNINGQTVFNLVNAANINNELQIL